MGPALFNSGHAAHAIVGAAGVTRDFDSSVTILRAVPIHSRRHLLAATIWDTSGSGSLASYFPAQK